MLPAAFVQRLGTVLQKSLAEAVDASQRGAQVVRNRVAESLEFPVGCLELGGTLGHAQLQLIAGGPQLDFLLSYLFEHLVERPDKRPDLVIAVTRGPD